MGAQPTVTESFSDDPDMIVGQPSGDQPCQQTSDATATSTDFSKDDPPLGRGDTTRENRRQSPSHGDMTEMPGTSGTRSKRTTRFDGTYNETAIMRQATGEDEGGRGRKAHVPFNEADAAELDRRIKRHFGQRRPEDERITEALMRTFYSLPFLRHIMFQAVPWLPSCNESEDPDGFWHYDSGLAVLKELEARLCRPWFGSDSDAGQGALEVFEFGDEASLRDWQADLRALQEAQEQQGGAERLEARKPCFKPFGRGLSKEEVSEALAWAMAAGSVKDDNYFENIFNDYRMRLGDALYELAVGEYKPSCRPPPVGFRLTQDEKAWLKKLIYEQSDMVQRSRNSRRCEDVISVLLQLGDRTGKENGLQEKLVKALQYLASDLELKQTLFDNLEHVLDAVLVSREPALEAEAAVGLGAEDLEGLLLPEARELDCMYIVERRKASAPVSKRSSSRLHPTLQGNSNKEERVIKVRVGDRVMMAHERDEKGEAKEGDKGQAHMWMGIVTKIRQNVRGRVLFQLVWDYHFLDTAEMMKYQASGRKQVRMRDVRSKLQQDPVTSRCYMGGVESNLGDQGLLQWQTVIEGMKVAAPVDLLTERGPPTELEDWQVRLVEMTPEAFERGLPREIEEELMRSHALGPGKGTYIVTGHFKKERFQSFYYNDDTKPAPPDAGDDPIVLNLLEPCCGCGGLSAIADSYAVGKDKERKVVIKAKWGVDIDAGAAQSFSVNHPGSSAYNMRFDEWMYIVYHREALSRSLFQETKEGHVARTSRTASRVVPSQKASVPPDQDRDQEESMSEEDGAGPSTTATPRQEPDQGLVFRVDQVRLFKNIGQSVARKDRKCTAHPLEPDRGSEDLTELSQLQAELEGEIEAAEEEGSYTYRPEDWKYSWLEVDFTARRPDGTFVRRTVPLNTTANLERYRQPLLEFLRSDRLPRFGDWCKDPALRVDVIASGPPCQNLTGLVYRQKAHMKTAAHTMGTVKNEVLLQVLDGVGLFRPKFVIIENVVGSKTTFEGVYQLAARAGLIRHGYQFRSALLSACRYLVPQERRRIILLASRPDQRLPPFPRPLNRDPISRSFAKVATGSAVAQDQDDMTISQEDLHPRDLFNPPVVVGDIMGRLQDLTMEAGGRPEDAYRSGPRTPLQLMLRWGNPEEARARYEVGRDDRFFSSKVRSISLLHAHPKSLGKARGAGKKGQPSGWLKEARLMTRGRRKNVEGKVEEEEEEEEERPRAVKTPAATVEASDTEDSGSESGARIKENDDDRSGPESESSSEGGSDEECLGRRRKSAVSKVGMTDPADYRVKYPTTYYWTPELLDELPPPLEGCHPEGSDEDDEAGECQEGSEGIEVVEVVGAKLVENRKHEGAGAGPGPSSAPQRPKAWPTQMSSHPVSSAKGEYIDSAHNHERFTLFGQALNQRTVNQLKREMRHILDYAREDNTNPKNPEIVAPSGAKLCNLLQPLGVSPACVMEKVTCMVHPHPDPPKDSDPDPRFASLREMARIQTFPDSLLLRGVGRTGRAQRKCILHQIANAVPSHMAKALGTCIAFAAAALTPSEQELLRVTDHVPLVAPCLQRAKELGLNFYLVDQKGASWRRFNDENYREADRRIRERFGGLVLEGKRCEAGDEEDLDEDEGEGQPKDETGASGKAGEGKGQKHAKRAVVESEEEESEEEEEEEEEEAPKPAPKQEGGRKRSKEPKNPNWGKNPPEHRILKGHELEAALRGHARGRSRRERSKRSREESETEKEVGAGRGSKKTKTGLRPKGKGPGGSDVGPSPRRSSRRRAPSDLDPDDGIEVIEVA